MNNLSVVIPSHERSQQILPLIESLLLIPGKLRIIVIDTSLGVDYILKRKECGRFNYRHLSENQGISYSRNVGLSEVDTDFSLFMDDDFQLSSKTDLSHFLEIFKESNLDIFGGEVNNINSENYDFHGSYEIKNGTLFHYIGLRNFSGRLDVVFNYFLAKTKSVLDIGGWDNELKYAREHDDFFLRSREGGLSVDYTTNFGINHVHIGKKFYEKYEINNKKRSIAYFCGKWKINSKVEIRLIGKEENLYISITRFMGDEFMNISEEEIKDIYSKYGIELGEVPFIYHHFF